uniref:Uncharacterized protein n=1 Tax=Zea mays TaxID=4577 RepID=C0HHH7_MAIZE|nr:unknown [Zea mays]
MSRNDTKFFQRFPPPPPNLGPLEPFWTAPFVCVFWDLLTSAFFAFFSSLVFLMRSLISRRAASLAASRTSGFSALFFWITSKEAPTIDLEYGFLVARRLFFTASAWISFLCCFLYIAVQVSFAGFRRLWK